MLGRIPLWRHAAVAAAIVLCAVLAFLGVVGAGNRAERFDAKQVTVQPAGPDGVRITEVVDEDFGAQRRHGYERKIPDNFGAPTAITASSPDANADVSTGRGALDDGTPATVIRLGDPSTTVTGQHRYVLAYTLPNARLSTGKLALNIINPGETLETLRFTVIVDGMQLADPTCNVGRFGTVGGCTLAPAGDQYRVVFTPLKAGDGITIGGTVVNRSPQPAAPPVPPLPKRRPDHRVPLGLAMIPVGIVAAGIVFVVCRRAGRNEVAAGGAADAAYGTEGAPTTLVADDRMAALATVEFVPPKGIEPWQGQVLLEEQIDAGTVSSWFSGLIAHEIITLDDSGPRPVLAWGPKADRASAADAALLQSVLAGGPVTLGTYNPLFAATWRQVNGRQAREIASSGWWRKRPPGSSGLRPSNLVGLVVVLVLFGGSTAVAAAKGLQTIPLALVFGAVAPALMAFGMYWFLLRSRSAVGSGLAIRTESFRKFLAASEGRHVEWAWKQGLLREYSAWAVALGAADAWSRALAASNVPPTELGIGNPLLMYTMASTFAHTTTAPPSSGGGGGFGGGGFSGGSVGGGGGGGSSGSW